jgi:hypothetical protein
LPVFIRDFGIDQTAFSKSTSPQVASISSLLRTSVSSTSRRARRMVGSVAVVSSRRCISRISDGDSARSFGTKVAIDEGQTSSAGFGAFSPCMAA